MTGAPITPAAPTVEGVQWGRYLAALRRFKWLMLLIVILGTVAGYVVTRFLKPEYITSATIWIEEGATKQGPVRPGGLLQSYAWLELLRTNVVLDSVALKLRLYLRPEEPADRPVFRGFSLAERFMPGRYVLEVDEQGRRYRLVRGNGALVEQGVVGDSIGRPVGFRWAPTAKELGRDRTIEFALTTPREVSNQILSRLRPTMAEDGNFIRIQLTGHDPQELATTLNAISEQFVNVAAELKRAKLSELSRLLKQQLDTTYQLLREAENRLQSYRVQVITEPTEGPPVPAGLGQTTPTAQGNYFALKTQIEQLRRERQAIADVLARSGTGGENAVDAFQTIPAVQRSVNLAGALKELATYEAELRALLMRYTPEHKLVRDVEERMQTLRSQTIPTYARALIDQLRLEENQLQGQIDRTAQELRQIPQRTITEQRLSREMASLEALYKDLQGRYESNRLAELSALPDLRVMDQAVAPKTPTSNTAPRIMLMAFLGSLGAAVALAILLDQLDKRFRYPEQVSQELGLAILGAVPSFDRSRVKQDPEEMAQVSEAFRTIRLNLAHSYGAAGPVMLTVTSPGPGDGKSLISANLANSFAQAGYRTLLIDGDIRRGELNKVFGFDRRPGLVDYLSGGATLEQILRPGPRGVTVIPSGVRRYHGPELLGSAAMSQLMAEMKAQFDVIIVDSPPLGAGIDPFVLATATGHMLLVLRSGETDRQMAEAKLRLVDRLPIRVLGAVLNDIRPGDGTYRYYSYIYGYTTEEEEAPQIGAGTGEPSREA
ncbi:MAG TPA: polysaccharide biosynthesis tyrosine autokinase [Gemmatimonadales bacterium]|nr:polysaccharide biosynthesis tyrosine autokinase [Gemmatimonadales bacterium]